MADIVELLRAYLKLSVDDAGLDSELKEQEDKYKRHVDAMEKMGNGSHGGGGGGGGFAGIGGGMEGRMKSMLDVLKKTSGGGMGGGAGGAMDALGGMGKAMGAMKGVGGAMEGLAGAAGALGGPAGIALAVGITVANQAVELIGKTISALKAMSVQIADMAKAANPAVYERWQFVMRDLDAVLGRSFVPALESVIRYTRDFADVLYNLTPSQEAVRNLLQQLDPAFQDLKEIGSDLAPLIRYELTGALAMAAGTIKFFVSQLRLMIEVARALPGANLVLGLGHLDRMKHGEKSSVGLGNFAQPQFQDFLSVQRGARTASLRQAGMQGGMSDTAVIRQKVEEIPGLLQEAVGAIKGLVFVGP